MKRGEAQQGEAGDVLSLPSVIAAAHELKSPLVLIRQLAHELASGELSDAEARQALDRMLHTADTSLRLTTDLTKTVRLEHALFELEPLNITQLADDVVRELSPLFSAHGKSLRVQRVRHAPLGVGHRDLLRRILMNFSDNALQYGEPGSSVALSIRASQRKKTVRIGVRDTGPAISSSLLGDVARVLTRPESIHARPRSSGLGLYIAHQFASAMNAHIGVTRHRDGATFYIDLPISEQLSLL